MESPEIVEFQKTIEGLATLMKSRDILEDKIGNRLRMG